MDTAVKAAKPSHLAPGECEIYDFTILCCGLAFYVVQQFLFFNSFDCLIEQSSLARGSGSGGGGLPRLEFCCA